MMSQMVAEKLDFRLFDAVHRRHFPCKSSRPIVCRWQIPYLTTATAVVVVAAADVEWHRCRIDCKGELLRC